MTLHDLQDHDIILQSSLAEGYSTASPPGELRRCAKLLGPPDRYAVDDSTIPVLEESLSHSQLPDYLLVHDPHCVTEWHAAYKSLGWATPYYRVTDPDHGLGEAPQAEHLDALLDMDESERRRRTARLLIHLNNRYGGGDHSVLYHAPLSLEGGEGPPRTVAAKVVAGTCHTLEALRNEASMYTRFPKDLVEGTADSPAVVPKFYGLYMPLDPQHHVNEHRRKCRALSTGAQCKHEVYGPILLMEACGVPLIEMRNAESMVQHGSTLRSLMERFHTAGFLHGYVYAHNLLVQPGPLHVPCEQRNYDNPSFRIVDFRRTTKSPSILPNKPEPVERASAKAEQAVLSLELKNPRRPYWDTLERLVNEEEERSKQAAYSKQLRRFEEYLVQNGFVKQQRSL